MKVVGSNPSNVYSMDIFHVFLLEKCLFVKTKINEKEAGNGSFKKVLSNF